ncbi:MAG: spondin domain-containing protein, partial [Chloroflexi bacterium]|nr:spondin domain-containing protein [Chloroflexota bacterium]
MKKLLRPRIIAVTAALLLLLTTGVIYADNDGGARVYKVTITNLTSGQPFTPPLLATHKKSAGIFEVGEPSSFELKEIAENGNLAPLVTALDENDKVHDVVAGGAPLVPAANPGGTPFGSSASFLIKAGGGAKYLSWASMLICTNDGFTGIDSLSLPKKIGHKVTVMTAGYDGGTEINTEDFADIVPPCQGLIGVSSADGGTGMSNPALLEDDVIRMHPGIMGGDDLVPGIHGWTDPVAMVMVERIPLKFAAKLDGSQEVPPVDTETMGRFRMAFNSYLSEA